MQIKNIFRKRKKIEENRSFWNQNVKKITVRFVWFKLTTKFEVISIYELKFGINVILTLINIIQWVQMSYSKANYDFGY